MFNSEEIVSYTCLA